MIGEMSRGHWHNKKPDLLQNSTRRWKGGGTVNVTQPTPAPAPTTAEAMQQYVASLPAMYEAQLKYDPLIAAQQASMVQQYALPLAQAYQQADQALYPQTAALQENMAKTATEGMNATTMPDWMRKQYQSDMNAQLGTNAGSPMGADYVSKGMQQQLFGQQKYYRDLGLSLAGRQPLSVAQAPQGAASMTNYTPDQGLNYTANTYGANVAASRPIATYVPPAQRGTSLGLLGTWGSA